MDYGVTITRGAAPWQIFQQGPDGTACIRLEGKYHLVHLSQELPLQFSAVPHAKTTVKAEIYYIIKHTLYKINWRAQGNPSFRGRNVRCWTAKTGR